MIRWLDEAMSELRQRFAKVIVIVDPDGIIGTTLDPTIYGDVETANGLWQLRCSYELRGRRRSPDATTLVLVLTDPSVRDREQLPWDIGKLPTAVLVAPVPASIQPLVHALDGELADLAVAEVRAGRDAVIAVARRGWGVAIPNSDSGNELAAAVRLVTGAAPRALLAAAAAEAHGPLTRAVLVDPPARDDLDLAWEDWLAAGSTSRYDSALRGCGPVFLALIHQGLVRPTARRATDIPDWTVAGSKLPEPTERVRALLGTRPATTPSMPSEWITAADWWGHVRLAAAAAAPLPDTVRADVEGVWDELDVSFRSWLREEYGALLSRTAVPPLTVDKIASYLARRLREGTPRALLLVMDGLAMTQWHQLRELLGINVVESTGCFAMLPTMTTVSRQAIFAGTLPTHFPESIDRTQPEERRWRGFWRGQGLGENEVGWQRLDGADVRERLTLTAAHRVVGVAVNAIDDVMHGSDVNGDAQMYAAVQVWTRHGFLQQLLAEAHAAGFEVWITADHGNVEGRGRGVGPNEGVRALGRGQRVRIYREEVFAASARLHGDMWIPPSYPQSAGVPIFASGRDCYTGTPTLVSHGSLSIDEVIVPLARVEP